MFRSVRAMRLSLVVAVVFSVVGCAEPQVDVRPDVRAAVGALSVLPVELGVAHAIVVRDCLVEAGFDAPLDTAGAEAAGSRTVAAGLVGLFASEKAARDLGYSTTVASDAGGAGLDGYQDSLPEADRSKFEEALRGPAGGPVEKTTLENGMEFSKPATGCLAEGDEAVYGSVAQAMALELFTNDVTAQAQEFTGDVRSAVEKRLPAYHECMAKAGWQVSGVSAAEVAAAEFGQYRLVGEPPTPAEQELAATDFGCQNQAGLRAGLEEVFQQKASSWMSRNETRILALDDELGKSMARATAIING